METKANIKKVNHIRKTCPGYIGGPEIAKKATDTQILDLVDLQDEHAELANRMTANRRQQANQISIIKTQLYPRCPTKA